MDSGSLFRVVGVEEGVEMAGSCRRPKVGGKHQGQSSQLDMHIIVNDIITAPEKRLGNQYRKGPKTVSSVSFPLTFDSNDSRQK